MSLYIYEFSLALSLLLFLSFLCNNDVLFDLVSSSLSLFLTLLLLLLLLLLLSP